MTIKAIHLIKKINSNMSKIGRESLSVETELCSEMSHKINNP